MKLGCLVVRNFGSWASAAFDFSNIGAALIYGKTGAGKSSIMDAVCWTLFGVTAKDGTSNEVRAWGVDEPTETTLNVGDIVVKRSRGKPSQNDLYWIEGASDVKHRGKDLTETQKLLERRLGASKELFLTGAYFHEFSETGQFFLAKAKDRRAILERVSDLSLPVKIADACVVNKKTAKAQITDKTAELNRAEGRLSQLLESKGAYEKQRNAWTKAQAILEETLQAQADNFDSYKLNKVMHAQANADDWDEKQDHKIDALIYEVEQLEASLEDVSTLNAEIIAEVFSSKCSKCGGPDKAATKRIDALNSRVAKNNIAAANYDRAKTSLADAIEGINPFTALVEAAQGVVNTYTEQLERQKEKVNPFIAMIAEVDTSLTGLGDNVVGLEAAVTELEHRHACLTTLYDLSFNLRGVLLSKAVKEIEESTNKYLEEYFDAELRVGFSVAGGDSIDVEIQKSGNAASFTQLSKGQRQLLKLTFAVSVMKAAANNSGVHFENLFLDESLDGLDSSLKIKAYRLFEELATDHASVLVIDHSPELHTLFTKRYQVVMEGDGSELIDES